MSRRVDRNTAPLPPDAMQSLREALGRNQDKADEGTLVDVRMAVARLPPEIRDVATMVFMDGRCWAEVAARLGVSRQTVWRRMVKARRFLMRELRSYKEVAA